MQRDAVIVKKFYRDLTDDENRYLGEILMTMRDADVEIPSHVLKRMIDRNILPRGYIQFDEGDEVVNRAALAGFPGHQDAVLTFDKGVIYEISNEGLGRGSNPFRIVLAHEFSDGSTYFVKIAPSWDPEEVRLLDVWKRKGKVPIYPPKHSVHLFVTDWDVVESLEEFFYAFKEQEVPAENQVEQVPYADVS